MQRTLLILGLMGETLQMLPRVETHYRLLWAPLVHVLTFLAALHCRGLLDFLGPFLLPNVLFGLGAAGGLLHYATRDGRPAAGAAPGAALSSSGYLAAVRATHQSVRTALDRAGSYRGPWAAAAALLLVGWVRALFVGPGMMLQFVHCLALYAMTVILFGAKVGPGVPPAGVPEGAGLFERLCFSYGRAPHVDFCVAVVMQLGLGLGAPRLVQLDAFGSAAGRVDCLVAAYANAVHSKVLPRLRFGGRTQQ